MNHGNTDLSARRDRAQRVSSSARDAAIGTHQDERSSTRPVAMLPEPGEDGDLPPVPEWVRRLRAKGYKVTIGTVGPPGLPDVPYPGFEPPEVPRLSIRQRLASVARRLPGVHLLPRRRPGDSHGTVP